MEMDKQRKIMWDVLLNIMERADWNSGQSEAISRGLWTSDRKGEGRKPKNQKYEASKWQFQNGGRGGSYQISPWQKVLQAGVCQEAEKEPTVPEPRNHGEEKRVTLSKG